MKLIFFCLFSIYFLKAEYLEFIDSTIDPDTDCNEIKKAHPEMKIVCQENTPSSAPSSTHPKETPKENDYSDSSSIDNFLNEESSFLKDSVKKKESLDEKKKETPKAKEIVPDSSLTLNSIISAQNDVISNLKSIDLPSLKPTIDQNNKKKRDIIEKTNVKETNFLSQDINKNFPGNFNENKPDNKKSMLKFNEKSQSQDNFYPKPPLENNDFESIKNQVETHEKNSFLDQKITSDFNFKEKSGETINQNSEESFKKTVETMENGLKMFVSKELLKNIKEKNDENENNIKELLFKESDILSKNSKEIFSKIKEISNEQDNLKKQMAELNENQKNLLKFLQQKLDSKEEVTKLQNKNEDKDFLSIREEKPPSKIDYKKKLTNLFDLIKQELH